MSTGLRVLILPLFAIATQASGQVFTIWAEAPETVNPGETFTVEFWGSAEGDPWADGTSAMAGFGIDARGSGNVANVTAATIADWAVGFGTVGTVQGIDVNGIAGGQLPNIFWINPNINMNNPLMLFSIEVWASAIPGSITYVPDNPSANGGLSFYPDSEDGNAIIAPNDPGTTLVLVGATTRIVPTPAALAVFGFTALTACRRRRTGQAQLPMKARRMK